MKKRESFNNQWGFILACIGSAVGMGNIWMFPTRVSMYGGGAYLLLYIIFVALISFTGVIGEMSFGRAAKSGPIDAFGLACESKGKRKLGEILGLIPVLGSLAMAIGYTVVMGWILKYMIGSFTGSTLSPQDTADFAGKFGNMASSFGNNLWQFFALAAGIGILMFGVGRGIEKANKIMMPVFFVLFIILGIYVFFQPGSTDGYKYIFTIDTQYLLLSRYVSFEINISLEIICSTTGCRPALVSITPFSLIQKRQAELHYLTQSPQCSRHSLLFPQWLQPVQD